MTEPSSGTINDVPLPATEMVWVALKHAVPETMVSAIAIFAGIALTDMVISLEVAGFEEVQDSDEISAQETKSTFCGM